MDYLDQISSFYYPENAAELTKKLDRIEEKAREEYNFWSIDHKKFQDTHYCVNDKMLESSKITRKNNFERYNQTDFEAIWSQFRPYSYKKYPTIERSHTTKYYMAQRHILLQKEFIKSKQQFKLGERYLHPSQISKIELTRIYEKKMKETKIPGQNYKRFIGGFLKKTFSTKKNFHFRISQTNSIKDKVNRHIQEKGRNFEFDACIVPHSHMDLGWLRNYQSYWARKFLLKNYLPLKILEANSRFRSI